MCPEVRRELGNCENEAGRDELDNASAESEDEGTWDKDDEERGENAVSRTHEGESGIDSVDAERIREGDEDKGERE